MASAQFYFYGELNDFLPQHRRNTSFNHCFEGRVSIKDMIEALGVPHTEVEAIIARGVSVDFSYIVSDSDRLDVYPRSFTSPMPLVALRPPIVGEPQFVLDTHLGQLAVYLRMLGFDTLYRNDYADDELARISDEENRVLLTRDRGLLKRGRVTHGYYVRNIKPQRQAIEIVDRYQLRPTVQPLRRCIRCNNLLQKVDKQQIADRLAPKTREFYNDFSICTSCDRIYWKGSHYEPMRQFIEYVLHGGQED